MVPRVLVVQSRPEVARAMSASLADAESFLAAWHADWAGAMQHVSTNPGYYSNLAWDGLGATEGWNWGSTASSLPMIGGTAMISELKALTPRPGSATR